MSTASTPANSGAGPRLFDDVTFPRGAAMPDRFMLAPLTNQQSHADGTLSDDEHHWLTMRADGGFGLVMTCASHVQAVGQGFAGQLGCFDDVHIAGLTRLAEDIKHRAEPRHPRATLPVADGRGHRAAPPCRQPSTC
ncbi:MAG: hypothetical protein R2710_03295 [Acidimicrobiales bacterium]